MLREHLLHAYICSLILWEWFHSSHTLTALELEFMERWVSLVTWGMSVVMLLTYAGYTLKNFLNLIRSSKCERPHNTRTKNEPFCSYSVWCAAMWRGQHNTHQQMFNQSPDCERSQNLWRLENKCFTGHRINTRQADPPSLRSKCFCAAPWLCLLCLRLPSARFWLDMFSFTWWCPDRTRVCPLGSPKHQDFWFMIGPPPTFFLSVFSHS